MEMLAKTILQNKAGSVHTTLLLQTTGDLMKMSCLMSSDRVGFILSLFA